MSDLDASRVAGAIQSLSRDLSRVNDNILQVAGAVDGVHAEVGTVKADLNSTRGDLIELRKRFEEYVVQAERTAAVQRSETVLGNVEAELDREYGHYSLVRRTSIGTLQAFDIGNVTNRTVQQVSEELMIQTPRYWLAPALVALAAWSRDDQELCKKSVDAAFARDPAKVGLFFALVLRRQGRMESATRWLKHFLASLDPRSLGREFAVILEATAQDAFGSHGRQLVSDTLIEWNAVLRTDPEVTRKQISMWRDEIAIHRGILDVKLYPHLSQTSPQWPALKDLLEHASAHGNMIDKYQAVRDASVQLTADMADRLDDILETLVTEYDAEELPYAREVIYHKAVIEHDGDLERAKEAADALNTALEETMDLVSLQTETAIRPELLGATVSTQQVAVGVGRDDLKQAINVYSVEYRRGYVDNVDIELNSTHSNFAVNFGFPGWASNSAVPQQQAEQDLAARWDATLATYMAGVRFKELNYLIGAVIFLVATLVGFLIGAAAGVVLLLLSGIGVGAWLFLKKRAADQKYQEAQNMRDQAVRFSIDVYRAAMAEFVDVKIAYHEEDAKQAQLSRLVETWPTTVGRRDEAGAVAG
ncbi:hypothetical protein [Gordonia sp. NB41Y]|uniref:hypothetical protein n=1 Tax=Gordonia sp. NB41Y TaxID=875808 RepID=UPI0002BF363A|nr:hypothetical protein [Gordonia sp. NB41Y]EMP12058.1 hypothetical protein ISGA_3794 [Gordonia sp. NB41Y]WLP92151.1 hypothetical protein Q9K23_07950 [Gordonia sp. NB41Y]